MAKAIELRPAIIERSRGLGKNQAIKGETRKRGVGLRAKEMVVLIYGLKNCDTCRKARKALPEAKLVDVREEGVPDAVLAQAYERFGAALLNTRSTTWRSLDEDARAQDPLALLKAYPALMKRPLIAVGGALFIGWNNEVEVEVKAML